MKLTKKNLIIAGIITIAFVIVGCKSAPPSEIMGNISEENISELIKYGKTIRSVPDRVAFYTAAFLGVEYADGPLGEGGVSYEDGGSSYDPDPLYRFDVFDCTTYVETIVALTNATDFTSFKEAMNKVRYMDGKVGFVTRNHFISQDWIPNNTAMGYISDITPSVGPAKTATTTISKSAWYEKLHQPELENFRNNGVDLEAVEPSIPYISLEDVFTGEDLQVNEALLAKIPTGAIINIVRPNWNLEKYIGTNLNISHQGIAIWKDGVLYYRNGSSKEKKVTDYPFIETFKGYVESSTIKGFDVLEIK